MTSFLVSRSANSRRMRSRSSRAWRSSSRLAWPRTMSWRLSDCARPAGEPVLDEARGERVELALGAPALGLDLAGELGQRVAADALRTDSSTPPCSAEAGRPGGSSMTRFSTEPSSPTSTTSARPASSRTNSMCLSRRRRLGGGDDAGAARQAGEHGRRLGQQPARRCGPGRRRAPAPRCGRVPRRETSPTSSRRRRRSAGRPRSAGGRRWCAARR